MTGLEDFEFGSPQEAPPEKGQRPEPAGPRWGVRAGLAAGLLLIAGGVVAVLVLVYRPPAVPRASSPPITAPAPPLPTATPALPVPPLDGSDAYVRELAGRLSSHPQLAVWLAARELVRRLAAVVDNVAVGDQPTPHLTFLVPEGRFAVVAKRERTVIDPRSFARWDPFAQGVAAIDAAECAQVFAQLDPLFEAAWRELGHPEPFRRGVDRAMEALLAVPVIETELAVKPVDRALGVYEYADARLERLTPAQKQLLRMGPANVARIQAKLRELQAALASGPRTSSRSDPRGADPVGDQPREMEDHPASPVRRTSPGPSTGRDVFAGRDLVAVRGP